MEWILGLLPLISGLLGGGSNPRTNTTESLDQKVASASTTVQSQDEQSTTKEDTLTTLQNAIARLQSSKQTQNQSTQDTSVLSRLDDTTRRKLTTATRLGFEGDQQGTAAMREELAKTQGPGAGFDRESYVDAVVGGKRDELIDGLGSQIGQLADHVGSNAGGNSAVALMQEKLKSTAQKDLAATRANANLQASQVELQQEDQRFGKVATATNSLQGNLATMLGSLMGSQQTNESTGQGNSTTVAQTKESSRETGTQSTKGKATRAGKTIQKVANVGTQQTTGTSKGSSRDGTAFSGFLDGIGSMFGASF